MYQLKQKQNSFRQHNRYIIITETNHYATTSLKAYNVSLLFHYSKNTD